ncbi:MAG: NEW3 domain-containing protein [Chloroflexota bacterium]
MTESLMAGKWGITGKVWWLFLLIVGLIPILLLPQPVLAQERQTDMSLRLVPNRAGLIEVEPGKDNLLFLEINNIGKNAITDIKLSSDKPGGWVIGFKPNVIDSLDPASLQTINVNIRTPANAVRGEHSINIIAEAKEIRKVENFTITVRAAFLSLRLLSPDRVDFPSEVRAGQDNALVLEVNNIGNKVVTDIKLSSDTPGWVISFSPNRIDSLAPGNLQTVSVLIRPPATATKERSEVTITVEANEIQQKTSLSVTVKPAQVWLWVWIIAGVVVIAGFVLIYLRFGRQ